MIHKHFYIARIYRIKTAVMHTLKASLALVRSQQAYIICIWTGPISGQYIMHGGPDFIILPIGPQGVALVANDGVEQ